MAASNDATDHSNPWAPQSWRSYPIRQQPEYAQEHQEKLTRLLKQLQKLPPLVHQDEVEALRKHLADVEVGKKFILQGGDCAERFQDCNKEIIENKLRIILQMSLVLIWRAHIPVVRILRGAGQFAKPRSSPWETIKEPKKEINSEGKEVEVIIEKKIPSFRGDNINGFTIDDRTPDPDRLLQAYFHSSTTVNYIRALIAGGFASLFYPHKWDLDFIKSEKMYKGYNEILNHLHEGIRFMSTVGTLKNHAEINMVDIFISHEGLILPYEEALVWECDGKYYNLGTHFLWIGDRTRAINEAHIEYFRGIANPIGLKCGPTLEADELVRVAKILNPKNEHGKLVLITRYGSEKIQNHLPHHIDAIKNANLNVVWVCDPMHGNTHTTEFGLKTRSCDRISSEINQAFEIHRKHGSILGGIHLEMTGENVTECVGGAPDLQSCELSTAYETYCDPRLNYTQSLDIAFQVAQQLNTHSTSNGNGH